MENQDSKFSLSEAYEQLEPFMIYLAGRYCNDDIMFNFDELFGELQLELVKGFQHYYETGKITDLDQLFAVLRKMMDNRIAELRYKHYSTHRGLAKLNISIDLQLSLETDEADMVEVIPDINTPDPEQMALSKDRLVQVWNKLSPKAQQVMNIVVNGSQRLDMLLQLLALRSIGSNKIVKLRPAIVANALMENTKSVEKAFKEIKNAYEEICREC